MIKLIHLGHHMKAKVIGVLMPLHHHFNPMILTMC
jgi:hypothetical protein